MAATANMWAPVGSPGNYANGMAASPSRSYDYNQQAIQPTSPSPSANSRKNRFSGWFSRSRSNSPNTQTEATSGLDRDQRSRSRGRNSRSKSPNEPTSPTSFVVRNVTKQTGGVSWEDQGDGLSSSPGSGLQYRRSKSKPIGMAMSLGVPPGGPGGGTGYGTATSPNDGRPIQEAQNLAHRGQNGPANGHRTGVSPPSRPVSPGHTKAAAFQKTHRISPGPLSWNQQQEARTEHGRNPSDQSMRPPRAPFATGPQYDVLPRQQSPTRGASPSAAPMLASSSTSGPRPLGPAGTQRSPSPPTVSHVYAKANSSPRDNHDIPGFDPSTLKTRDSSSPLNIPVQDAQTPRRMSADQRAQTFGFVGGNNVQAASPGTSPGIAARLRGFFAGGQSPGADHSSDEEGHTHPTPYGVSSNAYPARDRPNALRRLSGQHVVDPADREAEMQRRKSQREAARLVDEERRRVMEGGLDNGPRSQTGVTSLPSGIARELTAEGWTPEVLDRMTDDGRMELVRRLTVKSAEKPHTAEAKRTSEQQSDHSSGAELIDWVSLTPAQRIIAETRSRHLQREELEARRQEAANSVSRQPVPQASEQPVRRATKSSPRKQPPLAADELSRDEMAKSQPQRRTTAPEAVVSSQQVQGPPSGAPLPNTAGLARKDGLSPGTGPLPADFGPGRLNDALQDMMTRFYRYERYSVPLLRSLETRLVDIERDAQMAQTAAMDGISERTGRSARETEMDRWVGQMTGLMRHEIGQLKAGTREIREGREVLAAIAKQQGSAAMSNTTISSAARDSVQSSRQQLSLPAGAAPALDKDQGKSDHGRRVSSAGDTASIIQQQRARSTSPNGRPKYTDALGQPLSVGRVSPTPAKEEASSVAKTVRQVSTASAIPSVPSNVTLEAEEDEETQDPDESEAVQDSQSLLAKSNASQWSFGSSDQKGASAASHAHATRLAAGSPAMSDGAASATTAASNTSHSRSVNDRLKALMTDSSRPASRDVSMDSTGSAVRNESGGLPPHRTGSSDGRYSSAPSVAPRTTSPERMGDFSDVATVGAARLHSKDASTQTFGTSSSTVTPQRLNTASTVSRPGTGHLAPPAASSWQSPGGMATSSNGTSRSTSPVLTTPAYPTTGFIGGRTSPSPASYAGLSPSRTSEAGTSGANRQSTSGRLSHSPTIPTLAPGEEVALNNRNASAGLRARARSYLNNVDGNASGSSSPQQISTSALMTWSNSAKEDVPPRQRQESLSMAAAPTTTTTTTTTTTKPLEVRKERSFDGRSLASSTITPSPQRPSAIRASNPRAMTMRERVAFFEVANRG